MDFLETGQLLRAARRAAGLTQSDLAKKLHMSRATISQLETGMITELGVRKLGLLCDRLGLEVIVRRRPGPPTLTEAYAENKKARLAAFQETDATLAKMNEDSGRG